MSPAARKATLEQTKIHNTRLVLQTIYEQDAISRAAVARLTKLTRPTVSDAVARLIEDGLVAEIGRGASTGGKQPTLLSVAAGARTLIGIDLSGSSVFRGALVDLRGKITERAQIPIEGATGAEALECVFTLLDDLLTRAEAPVLGIGIASPGLIDAQNGIVRRAVNLGWQDLPLRKLLASRYPDPIHLSNDSHATALAEFFFGRPAHSSNLIVVKIGRGIGAGIVIHGDLYYGDGHGAGEIGHVVVEADGEPCTCGNTGCLETVAAIPAILRRAARIAEGSPGSRLAAEAAIGWADLVEAYYAGDPAVGELVQQVGRYLGIAIANLVGCFNIHNIVLAGRISAFGDPLLGAISTEMHCRVLPSMAAETSLGFADMEGDIGLLGGAAMLLKHELGIQ